MDSCLDEHLHRIPYRGCQLKVESQQPAGLPSEEYVRKFRPSTLASGYVKRAPRAALAWPQAASRAQGVPHSLKARPARSAHRVTRRASLTRPCCAGHKERQETFIRLHNAPVTKLMIVTAVPPHGCTHPKGDFNSLLSILNKQDYARWHSYEFHVSTRATEPSLRPAGSPDVRASGCCGTLLRCLCRSRPVRHALSACGPCAGVGVGQGRADGQAAGRDATGAGGVDPVLAA